MKFKARKLQVILTEEEARIIHRTLGAFTPTICAELYEDSEDDFAAVGIYSSSDLDKATDRIFYPLSRELDEWEWSDD